MTKYMQVQQQYTVEQEMQLMYMYDDFNNFVGVANETQAVLEYFKDDPEHPMVNINLNRLILQANISNGIHMDQQEEANGELLQGTRKDLKQLYEKVMGNPASYDERITNILKSYLKNLEAVMQLHQLQPLPTKKAEFNQGVVQKLVDGMSLMDNQVQKIRNGERYQKKTAQEIKAINDKRKEIAQTKLSANFPKKIEESQQQIQKLEQPTLQQTQHIDQPPQQIEQPTLQIEQPTQKIAQQTQQTQQPTSQIEQPTQHIDQPPQQIEQPTLQIEQPTQKKAQQTQQPTSQIEQPTSQIDQPPQQIEQPTLQIEQPTQKKAQQTQQPTSQIEQPTSQIEQPPQQIEHTALQIEQPTQKKAQQTQQTQQPKSQIEQPTQHIDQPPQQIEQPALQIEQPTQKKAQQKQQPTSQIEQPTSQIEQPPQPIQKTQKQQIDSKPLNNPQTPAQMFIQIPENNNVQIISSLDDSFFVSNQNLNQEDIQLNKKKNQNVDQQKKKDNQVSPEFFCQTIQKKGNQKWYCKCNLI